MPAQRPTWSRWSCSAAVRSAMSAMSAPAANTLGPPVTTTARTRSSASCSWRASLISRTRSGLRAFRTFGRLSVMVAIGGSISTAMSSYPIAAIIDQMGSEGKELRDAYGRVADDLRISITDRCNFRCIYCMPAEGLKWLARDDILRFEEIVRLARIFVDRYGVRTIRITGGEPLVRVKVEELVGMINAIDPTLDITMTTNGVLLRQKAQALKDAGLKRINISLDTLRMDTFKDMARSDAFDRVMDGITASREAGLWPIKLNMVVMKGHNDDEVVDFARLAHSEGYEVRFIEFMPLDGDNIWTNEQVVPSRRIQEQIEDQFPLVPFQDTRPGPATRYTFADGAAGGIGFISSVSQAFCTTCNRVCLTAEGGLRTCLFSLHETPLRDLMRSGVSDEHLGSVIETAIWRKEEGHLINKPGFIKPAKSMSQIGG